MAGGGLAVDGKNRTEGVDEAATGAAGNASLSHPMAVEGSRNRLDSEIRKHRKTATDHSSTQPFIIRTVQTAIMHQIGKSGLSVKRPNMCFRPIRRDTTHLEVLGDDGRARKQPREDHVHRNNELPADVAISQLDVLHLRRV